MMADLAEEIVRGRVSHVTDAEGFSISHGERSISMSRDETQNMSAVSQLRTQMTVGSVLQSVTEVVRLGRMCSTVLNAAHFF